MTSIEHDPGRGAPLAVVSFRDAYRYRINKERMLAVEGLHTGQFIHCGKKGTAAAAAAAVAGAAARVVVAAAAEVFVAVAAAAAAVLPFCCSFLRILFLSSSSSVCSVALYLSLFALCSLMV